jgi:hypothetical protein
MSSTMRGPLSDPAQLLEFHAGQMWSWRQAVLEQFDRMLETSRELQQHIDAGTPLPVDLQRHLHNDSQFLIVAAWLARIAAKVSGTALGELGKNDEADDVLEAISEFDDVVSYLETLRHRIEHIDDYLRGASRKKVPDPGNIGWVGHDACDLIYEVAGIKFNCEHIMRSVGELCNAVEAAIDRAAVPKPS